MDKNKQPDNQIIIYQGDGGQPKIEVRIESETVWLNQDQLAELFNKGRSTITEHILNIFNEGELEENSVCREFRRTGSDGKEYVVKHYNLDVIISVGYRVSSIEGTRFRQWATARLREYIVKGFTLDDERLKNNGGGNYWKELLDRIRDIRSSEKVLYRQVLDLYATSIDYNPQSQESKKFFAIVQNKLHYAANGKTASELISERADADKPFMGLMTFPGSRPYLKDVVVAKNYLNEKELRSLGQIISGYLDFAERQAEREQAMTMQDWAKHLDNILTMSGEKLLQGTGSVSHEIAIEKATAEYMKYQQKTLSEAEKNYLESLKVLEKKTRKEK